MKTMETAIDGLQGRPRGSSTHGDRVLATAKHFAGDGDHLRHRSNDLDRHYPIDQGIDQVSRRGPSPARSWRRTCPRSTATTWAR